MAAVVGVTPLEQQPLAEQGVDEGALAGVEFADDDQQEEVVELRDRRGERAPVSVGGRKACEFAGEIGEHTSRLTKPLLVAVVEDAGQHRG